MLAATRFAGWMLAAGAVIGQLLVRPSPDVSWLLYAARRLLSGDRLGVEILEVTPPMIFLPKFIVVGLAGVLGADPWVLWVLVITGLALGSITLVIRLADLEARLGPTGRALAPVLLAFLLLVLPGRDFGQREHLTTILVLPYLALAVRRLHRGIVGGSVAALVGVVAGLGIGIKPHFVLLWFGVVLLEVSRRGTRGLYPEHAAVVALGLAYLGAVQVLIPGYFGYALEYGVLYRRFLAGPPWEVIAFGDGVLPGVVGLGVFSVLRRYVHEPRRCLVDVVAVGTAAFYVAALVQAKGWRYHLLPSMILGLLLLALVLSDAARHLPRLHRIYMGLGCAIAVGTAIGPLPSTAGRLLNPSSPFHDADPNLGTILPVLEREAPGVRVAVLSSNLASAFPLVPSAHATWALRSPSLWPLIAFYSDSLARGRLTPIQPPSRWSPAERKFVMGVIEDLSRDPPVLLLVMIPDPWARGWGGARLVDYVAYFSQDDRFTEFVAQYQRIEDVGTYAVYRLATAGTPPRLQRETSVQPPIQSRPGWKPSTAWWWAALLSLSSMAFFGGIYLTRER